MKRIFTLIAALIALTSMSAFAGVNITKVDKVAPTDEMYMDMAVGAAKKAVAEGKAPCGAVVILNNAFRSAGTPTGTSTAEENAISKSRRQTLENATIYTIVEPTTRAYNTICTLGATAVYFVIPRDEAVAKGIYSAGDYDDTQVSDDVTAVPLKQMPYADAQILVSKYKGK